MSIVLLGVGFAILANGAYMSASSDEEKTLIKNMFGENSNFVFSDDAKELTFTVFADLHYKAGMYSTSISDLKSIFKRAEDSNSAFVLSSGDMTNDMKGSPELVNAFLGYKTADGRILNAYNVYGNHELETAGNTMQIVTPTLTNDANVHWGDGTVGHDPEDLMIGYYYVDVDGFRLICVDNSNGYNPNHYKNPDGSMGEIVGWEHYLPGSHGDTSAEANATRDFYEGVEAKANTKGGSLGDVQMAWLEEVLLDAADNGLHCIINGHAGYSGLGFGGGSSDAAEVRALYKKANEARPGTVVMSINGHIHRSEERR
jgi:3',5'-cyclic AMP phosphodiesterase CpdA